LARACAQSKSAPTDMDCGSTSRPFEGVLKQLTSGDAGARDRMPGLESRLGCGPLCDIAGRSAGAAEIVLASDH
jgi:hypothetical protein